MQIINLFPLSIVKEKISLDQNIKNQMIEGNKNNGKKF
tara:strand:- start:705 stop:818 length:114 start_codon:yes stop_codon:yes gene_type:complete